MANPQAENGHVDIAHEIIEALARYRIPGEAMQCLWVVFRKTYGWHKTEDEISLTQFSNATGLSRSSTVRAIKWLVTKKILLSYKEVTTYANKYKFNKNFDLWIAGYKKDTTKKVTGVTKKIPEVVTKKQPQVVTLLSHTKETSKETSKENTHTLFEDFWIAYPKRNGKKIGKDETLRLFMKLQGPEQKQAVIAAKNYFGSKNAQDGFAVDPIRFFKSREYPNGLWRSWVDPETGGMSRAEYIKSVIENGISERTGADGVRVMRDITPGINQREKTTGPGSEILENEVEQVPEVENDETV